MVLQKYIADEFKVASRIQMSAVILVLLIACANIASLQLTRATGRQTEIAVRTALGASRFRIVRQLLVESFLVAVCGGALGLLIASWGVSVLRNALNFSDYVTEMSLELTIDHNVLAYTIGVSALAAIFFGAIPAFLQTGVNLQSTLKEGGRSISQAKKRRRALGLLVTAQIAFALALLTGAGLMTWGFLRSVYGEYGIDPKQVVTANIRLWNEQYEDPSKQAAFFREAIDRLEALPGVVSAGGTTSLAGDQLARVVTFSIRGQAVLPREERAKTDYFSVTPRFLDTLRVPLLRGRSLVPHDNGQGPPVAVVNHAFVRRYFPNDEPLGKRVRLDTGEPDRPDWSEIVGVVGNVKVSSDEEWEQRPQVYESFFQRPASEMTLVVRTRSDPADFAPLLRSTIWGLDKDQPISRVRTMEQVIADDRAAGVIVITMLSSFAALAMAMAIVAVFGVLGYTVAQRTHEIGIRIALGAGTSDVLRMIAKTGLVLGTTGVGIGLTIAAPLAWLPTGMAPGMPLGQRATIVLAASVLLLLVALLASYFPARRATRIDPTVALRCE
jgi:putative ABC transport system permease protein